jgi:hypothetical protein
MVLRFLPLGRDVSYVTALDWSPVANETSGLSRSAVGMLCAMQTSAFLKVSK